MRFLKVTFLIEKGSNIMTSSYKADACEGWVGRGWNVRVSTVKKTLTVEPKLSRPLQPAPNARSLESNEQIARQNAVQISLECTVRALPTARTWERDWSVAKAYPPIL